MIAIGVLLAAAGAALAALNVANVPDAEEFLTAHKCETAQAQSCYVERNGTVGEVIAQVGPDSCTYQITFDDGMSQPFPADCAALSSGDRVTGRFWKGQSVLLMDNQGEMYSNFGGIGPVVVGTIGVIVFALGMIAVLVPSRRLRTLRRSARSQPSS